MLAISGLHDTSDAPDLIVLERLRSFGAQLAEMAEPLPDPTTQ